MNKKSKYTIFQTFPFIKYILLVFIFVLSYFIFQKYNISDIKLSFLIFTIIFIFISILLFFVFEMLKCFINKQIYKYRVLRNLPESLDDFQQLNIDDIPKYYYENLRVDFLLNPIFINYNQFANIKETIAYYFLYK